MKLNILAIILVIIVIISISTSASKIINNIKENNQDTNINNYQWEKIGEDGFGSIYNRGPRGIEIFNDLLVIGTANYNEEGGFIFTKTYMIRLFLYEAFRNSSFGVNALKSNGCEIWCYDGENLWQLVGPNGSEPAGFGNKNNLEVGVLIEFKGYLYAGIRNQLEGGQIWRTNDLEHWEKVLTGGKGNVWNAAIWDAAVFNDYLYVGTMNFGNGCQVIRTQTGDENDWHVVVGDKPTPAKEKYTPDGFGTKANFYAWSMCVYDNWLYVGTDNLDGGGEIWKTHDGVTWKPVIAYRNWFAAKLHGANYPRGFEGGLTNYRGGVRNMVVYKDELYCGFAGEDGQVDISLSNIGRLLCIRQQFIFRLFHPFRSISASGLEIWKYNSTIDKWTRVVGGIGRENNSGGFGDIKNEYPWSMYSDEEHLYAGTVRLQPIDVSIFRNKFNLALKVNTPIGGAQMWRYNGSKWEKINDDGFGDLYNFGIREMKIYKDDLIGATMNLKTGCQVWKYDIYD